MNRYRLPLLIAALFLGGGPALAQNTFNIDEITVGGKPVDGNELRFVKTIFSRSGPYDLNDPRPFKAQLPDFAPGSVYFVEVLSADFRTDFGLYGLDYDDPNARPLRNSSQRSSRRDSGTLWSQSALAYHPHWTGPHYLKIRASSVRPDGSAAPRQGQITVNVHEYQVLKRSQSSDSDRPLCECVDVDGKQYIMSTVFFPMGGCIDPADAPLDARASYDCRPQ